MVFRPRLRADLVVNNLVGFAYTTGEVLIASDGTPWRPLVHVEDICRAFIAVLEAPRELVHNQAFNVGRTEENYQIRDVASMVEEIVPGSRVKYAEGGGRIYVVIGSTAIRSHTLARVPTRNGQCGAELNNFTRPIRQAIWPSMIS